MKLLIILLFSSTLIILGCQSDYLPEAGSVIIEDENNIFEKKNFPIKAKWTISKKNEAGDKIPVEVNLKSRKKINSLNIKVSLTPSVELTEGKSSFTFDNIKKRVEKTINLMVTPKEN